MRTFTSFALLLAASLPAQNFVVDASNGPGTNFRSLRAAAAAVPDGATLLVRPGTYAGFSVSGKGLQVLADVGVTLGSPIQFGNTTPQQAIVLRGMRWGGAPTVVPQMQLTSCAGPILIEDVTVVGNPCHGLVTCPPDLAASGCPQLALSSSHLGSGVELTNCSATIESCVVQGYGFPSVVNVDAAPGIAMSGSRVQVVRSTITGGYGIGTIVAQAPAIDHVTADLRVTDCYIAGGVSIFAGGSVSIRGTGAVRVDPYSTIVGAPVGVTLRIGRMPRLTATGAGPGGTLTATTETVPGDLVVLAVGLRGAPTTIPGIADAFWLHPSAFVVQAIGVQQIRAPVTGAVAVPNLPGLLGQQLVWHALCSGSITGLQDSNPAFSLIR